MDDKNFFIMALENINQGIREERYSMAMEKIDYLIDILKQQKTNETKEG